MAPGLSTACCNVATQQKAGGEGLVKVGVPIVCGG
jgi:hypothetical protein